MSDPLDDRIRQQDLVVVNPPEAFAMLNSLLMWAGEGAPLPMHMRVLCSSVLYPVEISRPDQRTLVVRPAEGFLAGRLDRLFRGDWRPFALGDTIELTGLTIQVTGVTPDGRPAEARFRFSVPLEDRSLRWMYWKDGEFLPYSPPPVGQEERLESGGRLARWLK